MVILNKKSEGQEENKDSPAKSPKIRIDTILSLFVLAVVLITYNGGWLSLLENKLQDMTYQEEGMTALDIYVVGIDEHTLADRDITMGSDGTKNYGDGGLGQFQTWTRSDIADIINTLNSDPQNKPAVIGVDILFSGRKTAEEDAALVGACKTGGNVVLGTQATFGTKISKDGTHTEGTIKTYEEPYEELRAVAGIGHINTMPDSDGVVRHSLYSLTVDGKYIPSFGHSILEKYNEYWGITKKIKEPPLDKNQQWYITYVGSPGSFFGSGADGNSVIRVLNGDIDPAMFAGSIVLIGPYGFGMLDSYYTPIDSKEQMHGVEIHANIIQALMEENHKSQAPPWAEMLLLIALAIFCMAVSKKLDMRISVLIISIAVIAYVFMAKLIFTKGIIITLIHPIVLLVVMYITEVGIKYIAERKEKQKIKDIFKKYTDPKLVDKLIELGEVGSEDVGKTKDIAVMFVDVRGFTSMSERLKDEPETIVKILNEYLEFTSRAVFDNGGSVDKFIGDATMALFNGFVPLDDYEYKAVCAAWDIVQGAADLNEHIFGQYGVSVGFGIGVNCGNAVVGNLGPAFRKDFTAIGDTVNTAARLESSAEAGKVLIGPELYERIKDRVTAVSIGEKFFKGKSIELTVYELIDINPKIVEQ